MPLEKSLGTQHFKALFELAPFAAALASLEGFMLMTNERFLETFGYTPEEVGEVHFTQIVHADDDDISRQDYEGIMAGEPVVTEKRFVRKDGSVFWGRFHGNLVKDEEGNPSHINGLIHDITEERRTEQKLKASEEKFRAVFEKSPLAIVLSSPDRFMIEVNDKFASDFGYTRQEVVGISLDDFIHADDLDNQKKQYRSLFEDGGANGYRRFKCKDGSDKWVKLTATIVCGADGKPLHGLGMLEDVTEFREAQMQLEQALFSMNTASDAIAWATETSEILYANASYSELVGVPLEKLKGMRIIDIDQAVNEKGWQDMWETTQSRKTYTTESFFKKGDSIVPIEVSLNMMEFDGQAAIHAYIRDISDRKAALEELRASEESFRILFEENPHGIVLISTEGKFMNSNRKFAELFGYEPLEILEMSVGDLSVEGEKIDSHNMFQRAKSGELLRAKRRYARQNGDVFETHMSSITITDNNGDPRLILAMIEDMTAQQHAEVMEKRQSELERSNQELSQFVHIASHDLREPLRTVQSLSDMLMRRHHPNLEEHAQQCIRYISESTERMNTLIMGLLEYSRLGGEKVAEDVNLTTLIEDILHDCAAQVEESKAVILCPSHIEVRGFKHELRMLFQNLISNAIKFRVQSRPPQIEVKVVSESGFWHITVEDNGIGIPHAHYNRIFYIFQRLHTREVYEGTGIGLAHCRRIAELHGGRIWVESSIGEGSTFHVLISSLL